MMTSLWLSWVEGRPVVGVAAQWIVPFLFLAAHTDNSVLWPPHAPPTRIVVGKNLCDKEIRIINNTHAYMYIVHNGIKLKPIFGLQQYSCIYSIHVICFSCKNSNLGPKIFQRFPHRSFKRTKEHDEWCTINNWNLCKSSKFFEGSHSIIPVILRVGKCVLYTGNGLFHICHCQYLVVDKVKI